MLVLTRRVGEEIVIGGNVRVKIASVKGEKVRLAIAAPESIRVDRQEIHDRRAQFHKSPAWHDSLDSPHAAALA